MVDNKMKELETIRSVVEYHDLDKMKQKYIDKGESMDDRFNSVHDQALIGRYKHYLQKISDNNGFLEQDYHYNANQGRLCVDTGPQNIFKEMRGFYSRITLLILTCPTVILSY
eukprot:Awhi_evm5s5220